VLTLKNAKISNAVINRLPRYRRYLIELQKKGVEKISSKEFSNLIGYTASQIRQDLNNFGGFGQQGYGYNIHYLHEKIGDILGLDQHHDMILIGAGHLGSALVNYMKFRSSGFDFRGAFDIREDLVGGEVGGIPIYHISSLKEYLENNQIDIAVLTLPKGEALKVSEVLAGSSIRAVWNFAHVDLMMPEHIQAENVHLQDSLMKLSYSIKCASKQE
jgi:redox-sensing transcriptional repressor